jgi:hypothetical protein
MGHEAFSTTESVAIFRTQAKKMAAAISAAADY